MIFLLLFYRSISTRVVKQIKSKIEYNIDDVEKAMKRQAASEK